LLVTNKFNRRFNLVPTTTTMEKKIRPVNVLLVEDNPGDVRLTQEAFKEAKISIKLDVTMDGVDAIKFLRKEAEYSGVNTPDLILLKEIKTDNLLKKIPVVVLTTSNAEQDIMKSYNLHVNCYINKPVDFEKFFDIIQKIEEFWLTTAILPTMSRP
jgi:chemotaxis family two-component system response regulator Rcp1